MSTSSHGRPLTFALVGCGSIAPTQAKALAALPAQVRLAYCCDVDERRASAFAEQFGLKVASWAEVLANPEIEAITICTPSGLHSSLAAEAFAAGKHVVVEKPMDVSLAACDALLEAQRQAPSPRALAVISQHRFDPASQLVQQTVQRGELGRLVLAEVQIPWFRTQEYYDSGDWRGTWALDGGGCLMNQGIHTVDLMLWLCGPVKTVYAQTRTAAHERIEVEDVVCATLTFANGAIGTLMASTSCYPGFLVRLGLYGTEGSAILEGDELHTLAIKGRDIVTGARGSSHALQVATGGTRSATANAANAAGAGNPGGAPACCGQGESWAWGDAHRAQFADFVDAVRTGRPPLVDGKAGRAAVELIMAVYESSRTGRVVELGG